MKADKLPLSYIIPTAQYRHAQMLADMQALCAAYPEKASWEVAGWSENGLEIPVLKIGQEKAKYQVLLQGAIHGREHMTSWLLMALAECWLAQGGDAEVCWHILPMTNPDGVAISQSGELDAKQQEIYARDLAEGRTGLKPQRYAQRWKANGLGTDLNRNFPAGWAETCGTTAPSAQQYKGEAPFSATEARVLRDYTLAHKFQVTISYHASGSVIYYAYGTRQRVNQDALSLAQAVRAVTGYGLEGCDGVDGAGYKDWAMEELGIPSLTIEIGEGDAPLAETEMQDIFARNQAVLTAIAGWLREEKEREK